MLKRTVIALSLLALVGGTAAAYAPDIRPVHKAHGMARMQQRLNLTNDQMTVVRTAFEKYRGEQKQTREMLRTTQKELRTLALNGGDTNVIAAKTTEVQQLLGQSVAARVKALQEIGPVLTPEQRAKFAEFSYRGGMHRHRKAPAQS